jgi:hypothetical protein
VNTRVTSRTLSFNYEKGKNSKKKINLILKLFTLFFQDPGAGGVP